MIRTEIMRMKVSYHRSSYQIQNYFSLIIRRSIKFIRSSQISFPGLFTRPFCNVLVSAVVMCLIYSAFFPGGGLLDIVVKDGRHSDDASVGFTSQGKKLVLFDNVNHGLKKRFICRMNNL